MSKQDLNWGVLSIAILVSCAGCDVLLRVVNKQMAQEKKIFGDMSQYNLKVEKLQRLLNENGYNPGLIDGKMGYRTRATVKVFQKNHSLEATGCVGKKTWEELNKLSEEKSFKDINIRQVQSVLSRAGFDPGSIDGKIGPKTKDAIKAFQKSEGLAEDGKVGPRTWKELKKYIEEGK